MSRHLFVFGTSSVVAVFFVFVGSSIGNNGLQRLTDQELGSIRGAYLGALIPDDCPDFFFSEEDTEECQSPFKFWDVNDTCSSQACSPLGVPCAKRMRYWNNVFVNQYYILGGHQDEFFLDTNHPVECWVETECVSKEKFRKKDCLNPGSTLQDYIDGDQILEVGIRCEEPKFKEATGCQTCDPRVDVKLGDYKHLVNQPSVRECLDRRDFSAPFIRLKRDDIR